MEDIILLIIFFGVPLTFIFLGVNLLYSRSSRPFSNKINTYLARQNLTFKSQRKPEKGDWANGPFPLPPTVSFRSGSMTILGIQVPEYDERYVIIETKEGIIFWLRIETTLFSRPKLTLKLDINQLKGFKGKAKPKEKPDFIAHLKFLTSEQGGRSTPAASGYRPHFKLKGKKELTSAQQTFIDKEMVYPGEEVVSEIRILWEEAFEGLLEKGSEFELAEGPRVIAIGTIQEVCNDKLRKSST